MSDFLAGNISGFSQVIIGYPFDTMKILYQADNISSKKLTVNNFRRIYRGVFFPLISHSFIIGTEFYFYHNFNSLICSLITGTIQTPIDYFKIQKQIGNNINSYIPRGFAITISREIIAIPIYYNTYYYLMDKIKNPFLAGGLSGSLAWLAPYPIDTIKTRIQMNLSLKKSLKMKNFYKGLSFCLFRAFLVNGVGFYFANLFRVNT